MSDVEEQFVEINDELLISIVQGNPCLYAKNDKNFKNNKLKDMKSGRIEEKEKVSDPNANVIAQALKSVARENQLSCLIAVLQLIESFNH